ncbi:MAG: hypothetical protein M3N13_02550 [Candidatus Eremiobacteraeota bacterium]|nr:hypothetical protein [Candidatus Eremiobacteraeota bacterium]
MKRALPASVALTTCLITAPLGAFAQSAPPSNGPQQNQPSTSVPSPTRPQTSSKDPDVLLNIPNLSVQEIDLQVDNLKARLNLDAKLANLLSLTAGVDASVDKVKLTIKGVKASVELRVRLDNVAYIIDRTLTTIDRNPQIIDRLLSTVDSTVGTVGSVANAALAPGGFLTQTVNTLGQTVNRTIDATGNIVEKTAGGAAGSAASKVLGNVLQLPAVGASTTDGAGNTVKTVRDSAGELIKITVDKAGKLVNATKG